MKKVKTGILSKIKHAVSRNNAVVYPASVKHENLEFYRKLKVVQRLIRNADKDSKKSVKGNALALELCQNKISGLEKRCMGIVSDIKKISCHVDDREKTSESQKISVNTMLAHEREIGILKGTCSVLSKDIGRVQHTVEGISRKNVDRSVKENIHNISLLEKKVDALSEACLVMSKELKARTA